MTRDLLRRLTFRPPRIPLVLVLGIALLAGNSGSPAQLVIQGFSAERDGPPNPFATLGFVNSPYYAAVRQAVTNEYGDAVQFGTPADPGGVAAVTADVLQEVDIFVVTGMSVTLMPEEVCLLDAFVEAGGAVLSFRNEWSSNLILGAELGTFGGSGYAGVVDASSPVINGRLGTVPSTVRVGANSEYVSPGAGWPVLADQGRAMLVTFGAETGHLGRAVMVGDEEVFLNGPTPFRADLHGIRYENQLLFLNIIDHLSGAPGLDTSGAAALGACLDADRDGSHAAEDCDDGAAQTYPGAPEILDGADNDCDGEVDEWLDADGDGVPDLWDSCSDTIPGAPVDADGCAMECLVEEPVALDADGDGYPAGEDCDDGDAGVSPAAVDLPGNTIDENCDGSLGPCDPGAAWRNHGQYVSCVAREVSSLVASGQLSQETGQELIQEAARRDVGKSGSGPGPRLKARRR
jgi:hypothetical protein